MAAVLADDIFKCISLNKNDKIPIETSLKLVSGGPINNKSGDKPLPEPIMTQFIDAYMRH